MIIQNFYLEPSGMSVKGVAVEPMAGACDIGDGNFILILEGDLDLVRCRRITSDSGQVYDVESEKCYRADGKTLLCGAHWRLFETDELIEISDALDTASRKISSVLF